MKCSLLFVFIGLFGVVFTAVYENPLSDEYIQKINRLQTSWRAGRNFDINTPASVIKGLFGVKAGYKNDLPMNLGQIEENIPESFDAREKWPECQSIKDVRDQSTCGSCWAFGAVEAISDRICIHSNSTLQVSISANDLLTCCGNECGDGCDGGYTSMAWDYWVKNGIVSGGGYGTNDGCQSYVFPSCEHHTTGSRPPCGKSQPTPECTRKCDSPSSLSYENSLYYGETAYSIRGGERAIQSEILNNGPVEASFTAYADFLSYKSGVYQQTSDDYQGGHAVKIIGWGVENNLPYWLIANSWNEDWGDSGFFKILRGNDECGIEGSIVAGLPKL